MAVITNANRDYNKKEVAMNYDEDKPELKEEITLLDILDSLSCRSGDLEELVTIANEIYNCLISKPVNSVDEVAERAPIDIINGMDIYCRDIQGKIGTLRTTLKEIRKLMGK